MGKLMGWQALPASPSIFPSIAAMAARKSVFGKAMTIVRPLLDKHFDLCYPASVNVLILLRSLLENLPLGRLSDS